jgi:hypothetical protein
MNKTLLVCLGFLLGCGKEHTSTPTNTPPALALRAELYRTLEPAAVDPFGFADVEHCDATTYSGLLAASGAPVQLETAEQSPGRWLRRPTTYPECWANKQSRSTISRDAILSVLWWAWTTNRLDVVDRLWDYGNGRSWFMGDGRLAGVDTLLNTNMLSLLAWTIYELGGHPPAWALLIQPSWDSETVGYEAQLQVLQILLWGEIHGQIPEEGADCLRRHLTREDWNPLFYVAAMRWLGADPQGLDVLLTNETGVRMWPTDRLPTSADRCAAWVTMEDSGADGWVPCPERGATHSGGDLLLLDRILRGKP